MSADKAGEERTVQVGANLREARSGRGWSITDLAGAAGLSKGFVSQIENGKTSPSLETLERLAGALGIPLVDLVRPLEPAAPAPYVVRRVLPAEADLPVRRTPEVLPLTPHGDALGVYVVELPAGAALGDAAHSHEGHETCLVLAGRVQADQAGAWVALEAGDAVTWTPGQRHRIINAGPGPARLLISLLAPATLGAALAAATHLTAAPARPAEPAGAAEPGLRLVRMRAARRSVTKK